MHAESPDRLCSVQVMAADFRATSINEAASSMTPAQICVHRPWDRAKSWTNVLNDT